MCQIQSKNMSTSDGNIRISSKITIDLNGIKKSTDKQPEAVKILRIFKQYSHRNRQPVRHYHFHEVPPEHIGKCLGKPPSVPETNLIYLLHLCQKAVLSLNRTTYQLSKKSKITAKIPEIPFCPALSLINIHQVSDCLKEIKRQSHRHDQIFQHFR